MSYNNRIFNVNGEGDDLELFERALQLAFDQESKGLKIKAYKEDPKHGLMLARYDPPLDSVKLLVPFGANLFSSIAWEWLKNTPVVDAERWDSDYDHDGHNERGWRIYTGDWGHVETSSYFLAIKPVYCWYGK